SCSVKLHYCDFLSICSISIGYVRLSIYRVECKRNVASSCCSYCRKTSCDYIYSSCSVKLHYCDFLSICSILIGYVRLSIYRVECKRIEICLSCRKTSCAYIYPSCSVKLHYCGF